MGNSSNNEITETKTASIFLNEKSSTEEISPIPIEKPKTSIESLKFNYPINEKTFLTKKYSRSPLFPHKGVLLKTDSSKMIYPTLEGKVASIDSIEGLDTVIILDHGNNLYSIYANLEAIFVSEGEIVPRKRSLGTVKKLKDLYFQINSGNKTIDPSTVIKF